MKRIIIPAMAALALAGCQYIPGTEANKIDKAQKAVAATLKDPTSPLFTQVKAVEDGVCGMVNAKNSFGAYAGDQPFVWRDSGETIVQGQEHATNIGITAMDQCRLRVMTEACQAGRSMLSASVGASQCSDEGLSAIREQFQAR